MKMQFDKNMLAYCGLYCEECSFRTACKQNDDKHLISLPFKFEVKDISSYDCGGCKNANCICQSCKIKPCAIEKQIDNCADCKDFPCQYISDFENDGMPHHKTAVENLKKIKKFGTEKWFESVQINLKCGKCGERQSWYYLCDKHNN